MYSDLPQARWSDDWIPVGAGFCTHVQTGPMALPASYTMGTMSFSGVKQPGHGVGTTPSQHQN